MSGSPFRIRRAAQLDLEHHTDYLRTEAGPETASRFVEQARTGFIKLSENPGLGTPVPTRNSDLAGMRKWRIEGFPKMLVFYLPQDRGIRILRIFHAASDWWSQFDIN